MENKIEFKGGGTFEAMYAAQRYLTANGYSYGSSCYPQPTAIMKGQYHIAKWKNLTEKERSQVDGTMTGDMREGPVVITFFDGHKPKTN